MGLHMVIQKAFPYPSASQSSNWLSSWSCARGTACSAVLAQAFLPQMMGVLISGLVLVEQSDDCLIRNCHLCSLCQVLKSWFCCCNCCRSCRSIHCICLFQSLFWKHSKWGHHCHGQKVNNKIDSGGSYFMFKLQSYRTAEGMENTVVRRLVWAALCKACLVPLHGDQWDPAFGA